MDVQHWTNNISRLLAYSVVHADYSFSNTISNSYEAPDGSTNLHTSFTVPPSQIVEVEFGFYATGVEGQTIQGRLVKAGTNAEFVDEYIDDDSLTISTEGTYIHQNELEPSGYYETINSTFRVKWFLKFDSNYIGYSYSTAPQIKVNTGNIYVRTGKSGSTQYPAMFLSVRSFVKSASFKTTILT